MPAHVVALHCRARLGTVGTAGRLASMHPIWLLIFLVVVVLLAARLHRQRRRESRALVVLARGRNLKFSATDLIGLHDRYYNLELIRRGHGRHAWNVLYGSTDAGLIAVFRYSYDLGFGVNQTTRHGWVAVLENATPFENWRAEPALSTPADPDATHVGPLHVWAEHADTLARLSAPRVAAILLSIPEHWSLEARATLLAIAAPLADAAGPERLLDTLMELADALRAPTA